MERILSLSHSEPPAVVRALAARAGIHFNGEAPWDIQVHDEAFYHRILAHGSLGFGEAYMDGLWDVDALDQLFYRLLHSGVADALSLRVRLRLAIEALRQHLFNVQSQRRAFQVGERHYDIGNDVFEAMLDPTMSYSCGYWSNAQTLEQAQHDKLDLICRKLELQPGERLLDIGCGWGGLAYHAASRYGVEVVGITVSKEQQTLARERCAGLPVSIELMDYRDLDQCFDKVVSVGMFEHVGPKNYPVYFDAVARVMRDDGLFLLHTIGIDWTSSTSDPWIGRYIFPNSKLPSVRQLTDVLERRFLIEDWHSFGRDYDRTLLAWWARFNDAWPQLRSKYGERFYRMWKYYLLSCAGSFRARRTLLWQLVLSKPLREPIYRSVR